MKTTAALICMLGVSAMQASAQSLLWGKQFGTAFIDSLQDMSPDGEGGALVGGSLGGQSLLGHFDATGDQVWVEVQDNPCASVGGLCSDGQDGLYAAGSSDPDCGGDLADPTGWLRRYDSDGTMLWSNEFAQIGFGGSNASDVAADGSGGVYVVGYSGGQFLARYASDGREIWFRQDEVLGEVRGLATDEAGGFFAGGLVWPQGEETDALIGRYDADGNLIDSIQFGGLQHDRVLGLAPDGGGGVLACGFVDGYGAAFVARLDAQLDVLWMHEVGSPGIDKFTSVSPDGQGGALVAGSTTGDLGGANAGGYDAVVARVSEQGVVWIRQLGTAEEDFADGVATDGAGGALVTGSSDGSLFGPNQGHSDAFMSRYGCPADCDANGALDVLDFVCFQIIYQADDPAADCNDDGALNILDFVCFQSLFQAGCP